MTLSICNELTLRHSCPFYQSTAWSMVFQCNKRAIRGDTEKLAVGGVCSPKIYNNKGNSDRASSLGRKSFELLTIPGPWSPRPPRSSSGGPPETSPGVLSKKEVRLWQLHVQCAVKPPHCTSQLFRRKPLFCVETKEPFFSAHKIFL